MLLGEATIKDCRLVAIRDESGSLQPVDDTPEAWEMFLLNPKNFSKHQISDVSILDTYAEVYAWILGDVLAYDSPLCWRPPCGPVKFVNLNGRVHP